MRVHVHSAGRSGPRAWPSARPDVTFAAARTDVPAAEAASQIATAIPADDTDVVFAHSYLAVPAVLAARERSVVRLVLVEPAFYDIGRGHPAVEAHIATVESARARLAHGDLWGYWSIIRPLMFGGPADESTWDAERSVAAEFANRTLPWGHGLRPDRIAAERTLVVTGGWNEEYEAIAARLVEAGARHIVLTGHGHRPQDHPGFGDAVDAFLTD